jgi:hypothetical protein
MARVLSLVHAILSRGIYVTKRDLSYMNALVWFWIIDET